MEYIKNETLKKNISRIGLGTWAIGGWMWGGTDERKSIDTILSALEKGITLIDTAPVYGFGKSEEIVGKALKEYNDREKVVLSTKVAMEWNNGNVFRNSSPERIEKEIDDSLLRLNTDIIDIYHIHWPDPLVPIQETAKIMNKLFEQKKIRSIAVSNYSISQMNEFRKSAPLHFLQPPYNLFERKFEKDTMSYCKENKIEIISYGALCRGLLSGKMSKKREFKGDDLRKADPKFQEPRFSQYLSASKKLAEYATQKFDKELIHLALRWLIDKGAEYPLWGARKPEQLSPVEEIWDFKLEEENFHDIDNILEEEINDPVGPEFMSPPSREEK